MVDKEKRRLYNQRYYAKRKLEMQRTPLVRGVIKVFYFLWNLFNRLHHRWHHQI